MENIIVLIFLNPAVSIYNVPSDKPHAPTAMYGLYCVCARAKRAGKKNLGCLFEIVKLYEKHFYILESILEIIF